MSTEGFLSRWSRRKREVREAEPPDGGDPLQPDPAAPDHAAETAAPDDGQPGAPPGEPELSAEEIARLPSLEDITAETDLSPFLRKGIPESLRNAALRRMWSLDPKIRDFVSEAREYAYDWNVPGGVPGGGVLPPSDEWARMAARIVSGGSSTDEEPPRDAQDPEHPSSSSEAEAPVPQAMALRHPDASADTAETPRDMIGPPSRPIEATRPMSAPASGERVAEPASAPPPARRHGGAMPC